MHDDNPRAPRITARAVATVSALAGLAGALLAAYLAYAAIPESAWGTPVTPSVHGAASPIAAAIDDQYRIVFWMAAGVFALVEALIIYAALRFRHKPGGPEPRQVHGSATAEIVWTAIPVVIVLSLALMSYRTMRLHYVSSSAMAAAGEGELLEIEAIGHQWWWAFKYPDHGFETATEIVVPLGRPVRVDLESTDVIHSFWVPALGGKFDAVPGRRDGGAGQNFVWFVPDKLGRFEGQCAELCGTQHAGMRFTVFVVEPDAFEAWAKAMAETPDEPPGWSEAAALLADDPAAELPAGVDTSEFRGWRNVAQYGCATCHAIQGHPDFVSAEGAPRKLGPDLTRMATRTRLAGGVFAHTREDARAWIVDPESRKVGSLMLAMGADDQAADEILDYLYSLRLPAEVMAPIYGSHPEPDVLPPAYDQAAGADETADGHAATGSESGR